ncbi:glycoside hydrolase family 3 N-terminal domain-containing protein [Anaerocolumna xylanovorans]|uniref:Beta-glucosidase n=1 Tax=Anaerocolumna xylanovorans DSM 12503 TaxID=1121345 RepID=A0A1M7Y9D9_9FIRM|nr:glycoside hydrolase family 3 N-terminal domain-containing protein [Anaerocolumna xylanovorans]SHO49255.1 beta-glucosidase [Anaerocolumna xylanovorans DSM 12503]
MHSAEERAKELLAKMTLQEKIGQVNQRLYGFGIYQRISRNGQEDDIILSEEFKQEVRRYSGLGVLYGLYRADPWSGKNFDNGLTGNYAAKVYNMVQRYVIEHSRLGIPMMLSSECPHGHQALDGYLLPVNLAVGASFHPALLERAYRVCGRQMKEMKVDMALISTLDILRDPRWGRSEECYGEDPYLASEFAKAAVKGVQKEGVAAVVKHFCAQGEGTGGINASAARIGERELREIHLPVMKACARVCAKGVMAAYNEIDGIPCHANKKLLTDILRGEMGFQGIVMADGVAIDQLDVMTGDNVLSGALALRAGVDIGLWDQAFGKLGEAIEKDVTLKEELDRAVLRVLTMKYERGLFDNPYMEESGQSSVYGYEKNTESLDLARESLILLENRKDILPLSLDRLQSVAVIGPNSDALYNQLGDYTPPVREEEGVTVLEGIRQAVRDYEGQTGRKIRINHVKGCGLLNTSEDDIEGAVRAAKESDAVILVLGGSSSRFGEVVFDSNGAAIYSGREDMDCGEGMDVSSLKLPGLQDRLAREVLSAGVPVIAVCIQGRPYAITELSRKADGLLCCFYPGMKGGQAVAETIFGKISPSGCLPVSIPRHSGQLPVYYNYKSSYRAMSYQDLESTPLYTFGYGKSYTCFSFGGTRMEIPADGEEAGEIAVITAEKLKTSGIRLHFTVTNNGKMDGFCVPQLYIRQKRSGTIRRVKELKDFCKVWIPMGETRECMLALDEEKLSIWNEKMEFGVEPGTFHLLLQDGEGIIWEGDLDII